MTFIDALKKWVTKCETCNIRNCDIFYNITYPIWFWFWPTENRSQTVYTDGPHRILRTTINVKHCLNNVCVGFRTEKIPAGQYSSYVEACQRQRQQNSGYLIWSPFMFCVLLLLLWSGNGQLYICIFVLLVILCSPINLKIVLLANWLHWTNYTFVCVCVCVLTCMLVEWNHTPLQIVVNTDLVLFVHFLRHTCLYICV